MQWVMINCAIRQKYAILFELIQTTHIQSIGSVIEEKQRQNIISHSSHDMDKITVYLVLPVFHVIW